MFLQIKKNLYINLLIPNISLLLYQRNKKNIMIYKITIEVKELKVKSNFIENILKDAEEDKANLDLCYKINTANSKLHRQILKDKVNELNREISPLMLKFSEVMPCKYAVNEYRGSKAMLLLASGGSLMLHCEQKDNNVVEGVKYMTYSKEPKFYITVDSSQHIERHTSEHKHVVEDIMERMESALRAQAAYVVSGRI